MFNLLRGVLNTLIFFLAMNAFGLAQTNEQITLTTYYPSPQGSYLELRAKRIALGDGYVSPAAYCWAPAACANVIGANSDLVVEGRVGIGTITPTGALAVNSPVAIMGAMTIFDEAPGSGDVNLTGGTDSLFTFFNSGNPVTGATYFRSTAVDPVLYLKNDGKIGIGTQAPTALLHLKGSNGRRNLLVEGTSVADAITENSIIFIQPKRLDAEGNLVFVDDAGKKKALIHTGNNDLTETIAMQIQTFGIDAANYGTIDFTQFLGPRPNAFPDGTGNNPGGQSRLYIDSAGNIGIGTVAPGYKLTVAGTAWCASGSWEVVSDARLKKDIRPLENSLETILKLQGVSFKWIKPEKGQSDGLQRGFIAQDVEKIIPEWVKTDSNGYKSLEKVGVEALLVEAIKEQQQTIKEHQEEIRNLKAEVEALNAKINSGK